MVNIPIDDDEQLQALMEECLDMTGKEDTHMGECLQRAMDLNMTIEGLTVAESYAIRMFTDDSTAQALYREYNISCLTRNWLPYISFTTIFLTALKKLALITPLKPDTIVYRGLPSQFSIPPDDRLLWKTFSSSSQSRKVAERFMGPGGGTLLKFTLTDPRWAVDVQKLSTFTEQEVILIPFQVYDFVGCDEGCLAFKTSAVQEIVGPRVKPRLVITSSVVDEEFDVPVLVCDHVDHLPHLLQPIHEEINNVISSGCEAVIIPWDLHRSKKLVVSPTDPFLMDYSDVQRFQDAAIHGVRRGLEGGFKKPVLIGPTYTAFELAPEISLLGALRALSSLTQQSLGGKEITIVGLLLEPGTPQHPNILSPLRRDESEIIKSTGRPRGLENSDNRCALNCILQALSNTPPLLQFILSNDYVSDINTASHTRGSVVRAFAGVVKDLWNGQSAPSSSASSLKDFLSLSCRLFLDSSHEDAYQVLDAVLGALHSDLMRINCENQNITDQAEHFDDTSAAEKVSEHSTINDIFFGKMQTDVTCRDWSHRSYTIESFSALSLTLKQTGAAMTLHESLRMYTRKENLKGQNKLDCSGCNKKCTGVKQVLISEAPPILVLHLLRFRYNKQKMHVLRNVVECPMTLDIGCYMTTPDDSLYDLFACCSHSGIPPLGHYLTHAKNPFDNSWYCYNDTRVSRYSMSSLVSSEVYLLFYRRRDTEVNLGAMSFETQTDGSPPDYAGSQAGSTGPESQATGGQGPSAGKEQAGKGGKGGVQGHKKMVGSMPGSCYVRAAFEFANPEPGEIRLAIGDVVEVTGTVDSNWLTGRNHSQSSQVGNFPTNFVEPLELPSVVEGQKLFLAMRSFHGEMDEDLSFRRGEIIVGLSSVDASWWKGEIAEHTGIFPLTFVKELILLSAKDKVTHESQSKPVVESTPPNQCESSSTETESPAPSSSSSTGKEKPVARARATHDLDAQLDDELSLRKDDVIEVFHMVDDVFAFGRTGDRVGQFPLAFVEVFEGCLETPEEVVADGEKIKSKFDWWQELNAEELILRKSHLGELEPTPSFEEQTAPISSEEEYTLKTSHAFYSKPDCDSEARTDDLEPGADSLLDGDMPVEVGRGARFLRTLFAFTPENDNELGFDAGELVTVVGRVDDQWMEGELRGKRGIFPGSYVEICDGHTVQDKREDGAVQPLVADSVASDCTSVEVAKVDLCVFHQTCDIAASPAQNSTAFQTIDTFEEKPGSMLVPIAEDVASDHTQGKPLSSPEVAGVEIISHQMPHVGTEHDGIPDENSEIQPVTSGDKAIPCLVENYSQSSAQQVNQSDLPTEPGVNILSGPSLCGCVESRLKEKNSLAEAELVAKGQECASINSDSVISEVVKLQSTEKAVIENPRESVADVPDSPLLEAAENADATLDKSVECDEGRMMLKSALDKVLNELASKLASSESKTDGNASDSRAVSVCMKQKSSTGKDLGEYKQEVVACETIVSNGQCARGNLENSEMTNGALLDSPRQKRDSNSSGLTVEHSHGEKSEKPAVKPKPKPKPELCHPGMKSVDIANVPRKPSLKKGVSFCDKITVFPVDLEAGCATGTTDNCSNRVQRRSVDFESVQVTNQSSESSGKLELVTTGEAPKPCIASPTSPTSPTTSCLISSGETTTVHFRKQISPASPPKSPRAASSRKQPPPPEKESKKETGGGLKIGQSLFYSDAANASVAPSLESSAPSKKLPPRPAKPKPNATQGNIVLPNGIFYSSEFEEGRTKPVPCRSAPPRPQSMPALSTSLTIEDTRSQLRLCSGPSSEKQRQSDPDVSTRTVAERPKAARRRLEEELRKKRLETRVKVIQEVIRTEHDYLQSLCLCLETFFNTDMILGLYRTFRVFSVRCASAFSRATLRPSSTVAMLNEVAVPDLPVVSHVTVPYKDTALNMGFVDVGSRDGPVVVVLHGAPGGVEHFAELYGPLADKGIRVVAPEFPGYGRTTIEDAAAYDESTEARATLVHNFLTAVGISSVAAVGGHSMGVAAAVHLAANYDYFKSLVYLSGIGLKPHRGIWPYWGVGLVARLLNNVVTEPLTQLFLSMVYSMKGFSPDAVKTSGGLKAGIVSASRIGFDTLEANMSCVRDKGLPVFFAFTQNDRLVEWSLAMEVVKYFGTPEASISWLGGNEELTKGARIDDVSVSFPWVMIFERGGHFVQRSHQALVNQRLVSFVEQVLARVGAKSS